jgi:hypothetical protein
VESEKHSKDFWDRPYLERLLIVAAIFYIVGATSWSMPGFPGKRTIDRMFSPLFQRLGLWQGWDMFSPNPRGEDTFLSADLEFHDGTRTTEFLSRMSEMPYGARYAKERWRKFMNDGVRLDKNKVIWNDCATWVARQAEVREGKPVRKIQLNRHWRKCLLPGEPGDVFHDERPFNKFKFYELTLHGTTSKKE